MPAKYTRRREELGSICVREFVAVVRKERQQEDDENDDGMTDGENHLGKLEIVVDESTESEDKCAIEEGVHGGKHQTIRTNRLKRWRKRAEDLLPRTLELLGRRPILTCVAL